MTDDAFLSFQSALAKAGLLPPDEPPADDFDSVWFTVLERGTTIWFDRCTWGDVGVAYQEQAERLFDLIGVSERVDQLAVEHERYDFTEMAIIIDGEQYDDCWDETDRGTQREFYEFVGDTIDAAFDITVFWYGFSEAAYALILRGPEAKEIEAYLMSAIGGHPG